MVAPSPSPKHSDQYEIYVRPDGKKVRRIKRSVIAAQKKAENDHGEYLLSAMLTKNEARAATLSSAATVAGDDITGKSSLQRLPGSAVSKEAPAVYSGSKQTGFAADQNVAKRERKTSGLSKDDEEIATHYRKMLKMGMPDGAVIQKMNVDGVTQHIQDYVLAGEEPSTSSTVPTVSSQDTYSKAGSLSSEEQEIASKYQKMLRMGMPDGAVIQKMIAEGVSQHIQDSVAGDEPPKSSQKASALTLEEQEISSGYRKMLKMGMPDGAVMQKMSVDGVSQHIQDSVLAGEEPPKSSQKASVLTSEEQEIASGYRKMLKMGMPDGAVIQKMSVDGVSQHIQDSVLAGENHSANLNNSARRSYLAAKAVVASAPVPEGMALVQKDAAVISDGMVLVPKEQAKKTIPEGMVAVPKETAGEGVPEGYVLVPRDQVRGDPGDDLILVKKDQIKDDTSPHIIFMGPDNSSPTKEKREGFDNIDISGANIVSMDDLPDEVKKLRKNDKGTRPRFLLQALPEDKEMEDDFIRKNLLPASS